MLEGDRKPVNVDRFLLAFSSYHPISHKTSTVEALYKPKVSVAHLLSKMNINGMYKVSYLTLMGNLVECFLR